jgi:hypothetical protein
MINDLYYQREYLFREEDFLLLMLISIRKVVPLKQSRLGKVKAWQPTKMHNYDIKYLTDVSLTFGISIP